MKIKHVPILIVLLALSSSVVTTFAQGTAFTYQGQLNDRGSPANGIYDLRFALYDDPTNGAVWHQMVTNVGVAVSDGLLTTLVDLGTDPFDGTARWLEIAVATNDSAVFVPLAPRQPLTPAPYALFATNAGLAINATTALGVAPNSVTVAGIVNSNITSAKIATDQVVKSLNQLKDDVLLGAGTNITMAINGNMIVVSSPTWSLTGNADTSPDTHFLGTIDNQALDVRVHNARALRLVPTAGAPNVIGGAEDNVVLGEGVTGVAIGGGEANQVAAHHAVVGGGIVNHATAAYTTVGGGSSNQATDESATVAGGSVNSALGYGATIGGGIDNTVQANATNATISGGLSNTVSARYTTVAGGRNNVASGEGAFVGGGGLEWKYTGAAPNEALGMLSAVVGGSWNRAQGAWCFVGGGEGNQADGTCGTVCGGHSNVAGSYATVGGGENNNAFGGLATVGGGSENEINVHNLYGVIAGGDYNIIQSNSSHAAITGGGGNIIGVDAAWSAIGGGYTNTAYGQYAVIGGGRGNITSNDYATVSGGYLNRSHWRATAGGGFQNVASGDYATVPGGAKNLAGGAYSFAAGNQAMATNSGAFVWADSSSSTPFYSAANNEASFRCAGGVRFTSATGGGNQTVAWTPGSGSWSFTSDRNLKADFTAVDAQSVLEKVLRLPITEWNYAGYPQRHVGPMAQDFHALFPLNESEATLNDTDLHGVALAAIQGLHLKLEARSQESETRFRKLEQKNAALEKQMGELKALVKTLAEKVNGDAQ